jgi:hypothetical protein
MHLRGKSFRYEATWPDGDRETLLNVPSYDFNWQTAYRLQEPRPIAKGTKLQAFASFDNSSNNLANPDPTATVSWGDQSWDEMLIGYFDVATPRTADGESPLMNELRRQLAGIDASELLQRLDSNRDGVLQREEFPARLRDRFDRLDTNRDQQVSVEELQQGLDRLRR